MGQLSNAQTKTIGPQSIAVLVGTFLSGAMFSISLITVPVFLDTDIDPNPAHLLRQWVRTYQYGITYMPPVCIATCTLYAYASFHQGVRWRPYALAAVLTILMVPFTLVIMAPTNAKLYAWNAAANSKSAVNLRSAERLVVRWAWLHLARCMFPAIGAILGFRGLLEELRAKS